ncbi:MAG: ABC transporter permease subunit [Oscillospiraceae bacterium]|nr:ABC transporter permease subunit [Oscillospiraceae bacterium]
MTAIMKREFASYFTSPLGYVYLAVFYGFSGLFLWMTCLTSGSADMSGTFLWMFFIMMILIPILTMRTMADDKRQKTDQLTLTAPVSLFGLVMGKFLAAFLIFLIGAAVLLVYALFISGAVAGTAAQTGIEASFGWASVMGNLVGITLMGAVFISAGIFISSLTENQMIAAIGSIGANIVLCLFDVLASYVQVDFIKDIINSLSVFYKYQEFTYGIFSLKNIVFFVSLVVLFNFLTMRVLERRRWS